MKIHTQPQKDMDTYPDTDIDTDTYLDTDIDTDTQTHT